jgi:hypothetical protein
VVTQRLERVLAAIAGRSLEKKEEMPDPKFSKPWHGVSRESIDWRPTVNEEACIGPALSGHSEGAT